MNSRLYIGWDVGAWHCDNNSGSRDALCVLTDTDNTLVPVGRTWWGSLRQHLGNRSADEIVPRLLALCDVEISPDITMAIDAPLGWPRGMLDLVTMGATSAVGEKDATNPYTRRYTELELVKSGLRPLSAVRDMIGSQATKAMHLIAQAGLRRLTEGVWEHSTNGRVISAIETYPAAALRSPSLRAEQSRLEQLVQWGGRRRPHTSDERDALTCAIIASIWRNSPEALGRIPRQVPEGEGWIILPAEVYATAETS